MEKYSIDVELPATYHSRLNSDFTDRIKYLVPHVANITFRDNLASIEFHHTAHADTLFLAEEVKQKIQKIVNEISFSKLEFQETCLFENQAQYTPSYQHVALAQEKGWLTEYSQGVYGVSGFLYNLKQFLDQKFEDLAKEFSATSIELPSFISTEDLLKSGHFETFPHHVYLSDHIDFTGEGCKLNKQQNSQSLKDTLHKHSLHSGHCLTPSVCYNYYKSLENKVITDINSTVVTAKCRCFRYELSSVSAFQRQREFDMREIIFLGRPQEVEELRNKIMHTVWNMALELDIKASVKNAFDPFFAENLGPRAAIQFNRNMKFELLADCGMEKAVAISSFNIHSATFGKAFNIKNEQGSTVTSGCIGFGLERWLLALLSKYGTQKPQWPQLFHHLF